MRLANSDIQHSDLQVNEQHNVAILNSFSHRRTETQSLDFPNSTEARRSSEINLYEECIKHQTSEDGGDLEKFSSYKANKDKVSLAFKPPKVDLGLLQPASNKMCSEFKQNMLLKFYDWPKIETSSVLASQLQPLNSERAKEPV